MSDIIKVLLVEDDPEQLFLFQQVFNVKGLLTIPATNIADALKMVSLDRPDIVLLDIILWHENGLDIMEKLKKDPSTKDIPVFVFTNTDKKEYKDRAEKLGAADYIIKSETIPQEMADRIKKFLENRK
ncbi:MAG TPA: response regulator [Candidatus Moranbacteria bacterium]|nr:response regulator [Candidatus Moranbacteria bacterium]